MSDEIIKVLNYLGEKFGVIIDWSNDNIIPYIYDLMDRVIRYEICSSIIYIIISILICIGCIISIPKIDKYANKIIEEDYYSFWDVGKYIIIAILLGAIAISVYSGVNQIIDITECIFIPEKVFINFIQSTKI